jgi:Ca-activated chloride channel family protein
MQIEFARPDMLYLLALLPVWVLLVWPWAGRGVPYTRGAEGVRRPFWFGAPGAALLTLPRVLTGVAIASLIVGLAGPERVDPTEETELEGGSIGLVVDLSSSMLAQDMGDDRSRISVAREAAVRFALRRVYDEISLVAFGSDALTRVPLTTDHQLIVHGVESLEIQLVRDGTDISGAVLTAVERIRGSERQPQVIVLLTDGAHNGTNLPPLATARVAEALGIRIHTISVLANEDPQRRLAPGIVRERFGEERETVLMQLSGITGGRYFRARSAAALDSIYDEIDSLEMPVPRPIIGEVRVPLRAWFFLLGLSALTGEALLRGSRWGVVH